jgi:hypothetical protein
MGFMLYFVQIRNRRVQLTEFLFHHGGNKSQMRNGSDLTRTFR